ncbi:MAG: hypothetical protein EBZ05_09735, partial [Verrucomicrobia bacterium]|nr:hypothetical protein [Verrucomicrobiota bacterium]
GETNGKMDNGLTVEGEGEAAIGDLKIGDLKGFGSGGGGDGLIRLVDPIGEGEEVVAKVDGGAGEAEKFQSVMGQAVPGEGDVDTVKGKHRGKRVVGGVKNQIIG